MLSVSQNSRTLRELSLIAISVSLLACTASVQDPAKQFGQAVTTAVSAENSLFDAVDKKKADLYTMNFSRAPHVDISTDGALAAKSLASLSGTALSAADRKAISTILDALTAYGQALQNLAADTAATTFDSNTDSLGKAAANVDANALSPIGAKGLPTTTQLGDLGTALKDIGNLVINHTISKDVRAAAKTADGPLHTISVTLQGINDYWAIEAQKDSRQIRDLAQVTLNTSRDFSSRYELLGIWQTELQNPVTSTAADSALNAIVAANSKIATAGSTASIAEIQQALKAASDAFAAYKAIAGK
jgi:hypothetical protein